MTEKSTKVTNSENLTRLHHKAERLPRIKHLIPRSVNITYGECTRKFRDDSYKHDYLPYQVFRKKGYTKAVSIRLLREDTTNHNSEHHQTAKTERSILLGLSKKTKNFPSIKMEEHFVQNKNILRVGRNFSRIKSLHLKHLGSRSIEAIKSHIKLLREAKKLKHTLVDLHNHHPRADKSTDLANRDRLFSRLCRLLEGHNKLELLDLNCEVIRIPRISDALTIKHLKRNIKKIALNYNYCIPLLNTLKGSVLQGEYYYRKTSRDNRSSDVEFGFKNEDSKIVWKGFKADDSTETMQNNIDFWKGYFQTFGDFQDKRRNNLLQLIEQSPSPSLKLQSELNYLTLTTLLSTIRGLITQTKTSPNQQEVNKLTEEIGLMAVESLHYAIENSCRAQRSLSQKCNIQKFLRKFESMIKTKIYFYNNMVFAAEHLSELCTMIKILALKGVSILYSSSHQFNETEQELRAVMSDFYKNRVEMTKIINRQFYTKEEIQLLEKQNLFQVKTMIERVCDDVRKQWFCSSGKASKELQTRVVSNLYITVLSCIPSSYHLTTLAIEFPDTHQNQSMYTPLMIMNAPNLSNCINLKALSLQVIFKQDSQDYIRDLEQLTDRLSNLESLRLSIRMQRNYKRLESAISHPLTRPEELSSAIHDSNELHNMQVITRVLELAAKKFKGLKELGLFFSPDPKTPSFQLTGLASHDICHRDLSFQNNRQLSYQKIESESNTRAQSTKDLLISDVPDPEVDEIHQTLSYLKPNYRLKSDYNETLTSIKANKHTVKAGPVDIERLKKYMSLREEYLLNEYIGYYDILQAMASLLQDSAIKSFLFGSTILQDAFLVKLVLQILRQKSKSMRMVDIHMRVSNMELKDLQDLKCELSKASMDSMVNINRRGHTYSSLKELREAIVSYY